MRYSKRDKKQSETPPHVEVCCELGLGDTSCTLGGIEFKPIFFCINDHSETGDYPFHTHPFSELFYTISGEGQTQTATETIHCRPGHIYISKPGEKHASIWRSTPGTPWRGLIVQYNISVDPKQYAPESRMKLVDDFAPFYAHFYAQGNSALEMDSLYHEKILNLVNGIITFQKEKPHAAHAFALCMWMQLVVLISCALREKGCTPPREMHIQFSAKQRQLMQAKRILEDETALHLDIENVARQIGMSEFHFIREFRQAFGASPQKYRLSVVMERAGHILIQKDIPIHQLAVQVGYADGSSFSKAFHKYFGVSPHNYRTHRIPGGLRVKAERH